MKYLRENLGWHFRIRIKRSFQFQLAGQWHKVSSVQLKPGEAYFTPAVSIGKTKPYANVYLAFAHDQQSDEDWVIVSDAPTTLQTFAQYRLRFQVEESFLDLKSGGFNLEASRLRDQFALSQMCLPCTHKSVETGFETFRKMLNMDNPILIHAQQVGRKAFGDPRLVKRGLIYMSPSAPIKR